MVDAIAMFGWTFIIIVGLVMLICTGETPND